VNVEQIKIIMILKAYLKAVPVVMIQESFRLLYIKTSSLPPCSGVEIFHT